MTIEHVKREALLKGYTLTPVSGILRDALAACVEQGCDRASAVASALDIASTAASNRLRTLSDRMGVLEQVADKDGREIVFQVSDLGKAVRW